ncbi:MAG: hypothetical protein HC866_21425 [Leptolyngbyaceae cyanobacterium RU_5_1]|nr:hypothetical protein [Leptolyngbyaceae cyanobacterium RU_5_1]
MPGYLLNTTSTIICAHAGHAQPTVPNPRVKVMGQPVVTQPAPYVIAGCGLTGTPTSPCVSAQWTTAATRVRAGGMPVLLQDSQAVCTPTGTPLTVLMTQARVRGV